MAKNEIHFRNTDDCIKKIKSIRTMYRDTTPSYVALSDAIQALEEIQQYRAIGTVEDLKSMKENGAFTGVELAQLAAMQMRLKEYSAIGTIDEFKDLKEKSEAKKPILNNPKINEFYIKEAKLCPACHGYINNCSGDYCRDCGQKLVWQ